MALELLSCAIEPTPPPLPPPLLGYIYKSVDASE